MSKFQQMEQKLAAEHPGKTPAEEAGLAAYIGRKKFGAAGMARKAAAGRRKARKRG